MTDNIIILDETDKASIEKQINDHSSAENPHGIDIELIGAAPSTHANQHSSSGSDALAPSDIGAAPTNHTQSASTITEGTFGGKVTANQDTCADIDTSQVRNIYAGTTTMTHNVTQLTSGYIYLQYK